MDLKIGIFDKLEKIDVRNIKVLSKTNSTYYNF